MSENLTAAKGISGGDAAVAILPGAFGKGTFYTMFEWVQLQRYKTGERFQNYVNDQCWKKRGGGPKN